MTQEETNRTFDINFAELYDVRPGETDFTGAIDRSLEQGMNYTHTKDVTVSCSAANSLQNSL